MEIIKGRGYVYSLQYHLVWCVKYRHKILIGSVENRLKEMLYQIALDNECKNLTQALLMLCFNNVFNYYNNKLKCILKLQHRKEKKNMLEIREIGGNP